MTISGPVPGPGPRPLRPVSGILKLHQEKLRMPIEKGSDMRIFSALTDEHRKAEVEFYKVRQDYYTSHNYSGLGYGPSGRGIAPRTHRPDHLPPF